MSFVLSAYVRCPYCGNPTQGRLKRINGKPGAVYECAHCGAGRGGQISFLHGAEQTAEGKEK